MPELVPQRHERCAVGRIEITKGNHENTKLVKSPEAHEEDDGLNAETAKPAETRARRRPAQPAASALSLFRVLSCLFSCASWSSFSSLRTLHALRRLRAARPRPAEVPSLDHSEAE